MNLQTLVVAAILIATVRCGWAGDAFDAVRCDGDVGKALVGKKIGNEPVMQIEKRHSALGLKDEGGEEISDSLSYQSWTICGGSYHILERKGVVRDVIRADHSKKSPAFLGACSVDGSATPYSVFAILADDDKATLPASTAWRIDESSAHFIHLETKGMTCPRDGIATVDGGR